MLDSALQGVILLSRSGDRRYILMVVVFVIGEGVIYHESEAMLLRRCPSIHTVLVGVFVTLGTVTVEVATMVLVDQLVVVTLMTGVVVTVIQAVGVTCSA